MTQADVCLNWIPSPSADRGEPPRRATIMENLEAFLIRFLCDNTTELG